MTRVVVVVPGLLGPWAKEFREYVTEALDAPALAWWLNRGSHARAGSIALTFEHTLSQLFGVPISDSGDFPHAAFSALADELTAATGEALVRLDPVFLNATPHGAEVVAGDALGLSFNDARELVDFLNAELDAPWVIEPAHATRWYVRLPALPALQTVQPTAMVGAHSDSLLPQGEDGRPWRRWLTELQMLLHTHPMNDLREQASLRPINSAWLWGQGCLPEAPAGANVALTYADSQVARGLAKWHGGEVRDLTEATDATAEMSSADTVALIYDSCAGLAESGDVEGWRDALMLLERDCFAPLVEALRAGRATQLELHAPCVTVVQLKPSSRYKFWRPERTLSRWLRDV